MSQLELFGNIDFDSYDVIALAVSGGKDSVGCALHLKEQGVDMSKVEFWHHEIDGREGSSLMDWVCTPDYCRKFAEWYGVPIYFSWREGGFEREMNRDGSTLTGKVFYENAEGLHEIVPGAGYASRLRFPQVGSMMAGRWCSPKLKIDVARRIFTNDPRFENSRTLFITGERAEESLSPENFKLMREGKLPPEKQKQRAGYAEFEPHEKDARDSGRHIDVWRPLHMWSVQEVWEIIERHKVRAHPCYYIGYSRCSCQFCIFGDEDQWRTGQEVSPERFNVISQLEEIYDHTIDRDYSVLERAEQGKVYSGFSAEYARVGNSKEYKQTILMTNWFLPAGAYGKSCGPT